MNPVREDLLLPAPIEDLIRKALDVSLRHDQREPYRARMSHIAETLNKAIEIFDKQKS
jgi:hypothetical protein